ncbi:phosphoglucosamine mutase [Aestuariimicrobium ganziense]|uniref:phosphoglucosamine mutase n=1 Tax=Aestuariimicrobium ganziense TaxID=2773677 RepID=UPI001942228D|nr:phosphoglucosamine mutase [Aestuariimicrobium ganziense]
MARLFGTDGVRGVANQDLTAELALDLSVAAAHVLGEVGFFGRDRRPTALVGRDPRASGEFLESAVIAGLASAGVDVVRVGIVPTPGVAFLVNAHNADLGVMLSASHNPMPDNGIKFFSRGGVKLDDLLEDAIEERLGEDWQRPTGDRVGRVTTDLGAIEEYVAHLVGSLGSDGSLEGITVVLDAANGASWMTAQAAFETQGATVHMIHHTPDGLNINEDCGSTHLGDLQRAVVEKGADLGLAFDGDADRCLAVDANGELIDGDQILAILALALKEDRKLNSDTVVATIMSNLGLTLAMREHGIRVDQTKVGDRYVLESMNANGFTLGGEQSGHVIMSDFATTGDGVLTGLHLAARMATTGKSIAELAAVMTRLPQVMVNVKGVDKTRAGIDPEIQSAVSAANRELGDTGRVVLRPSGTEPVVRVMVEADTTERATEICHRLADLVKARVSLG